MLSKDKIIYICIGVFLLFILFPPTQAKPKPRTVYWAKTMPHSTMLHRTSCKGHINRIWREL